MDNNEETFIDGESRSYGNENSKFEQLLLKQMNKCAEVLSKEIVIGYMKKSDSATGKGQNQVWIEDTRQVLINSIDTFRMFMNPFLDSEYKEQIDKIIEKAEEFKNQISERLILVKGMGPVKFKTLKDIPAEHPYLREYINYKSELYRTMFEILVSAYHNKKSEIAKFSYE